ncbi:hypothetical protein PISMIDRAFT_13045, partial [Pisolithus microcarpus 441]
MSSTTANPTMPLQAQAAANAHPNHSVLTMPLLGTKSSPELFQGDCSRVRTFLDHYERLCTFHNVTTDQEMVTSILQYCNTRVREIIEGMPHFHIPDWVRLKASLLRYFDADIFDERFFERDLKSLAYERSVNATQPTNTVHFVIHEEANEYLRAEIFELEDEAVVAAAERNAKILKDKHREVFDGVLLPPRSHGKGKEREFPKQSTSSTPVNQPQLPIKPSSATVDPPSAPILQPSKRADLTPVTQPHATITAPQAPVFVPVNVHRCGFDGNDDDAIMEDESINKPSHQASDSPADKGRKSKPTAAMTSPLSQSADPKAIVDRILATPMTLSLGEVIGASRDVSHHLQELI